MLKEEVIWIGERLSEMDAAQLSPMLDIGSSTHKSRTVLGKGWKFSPQVLFHLLWLWRPYRITCAVTIKV